MVTTIEQLKAINRHMEIVLPNFPDGTPLEVIAKKPSLITMMCEGRIANPLAAIALEMTGEAKNGKPANYTPEQQKQALEFVHNVAKECLIQPTFAEIEEYAGGLTDEQYMVLYNAVTSSVDQLKPFC